jgi:hypothetical protein
MIKHEVKDDVLHLTVEGMDKVWALKSELSIPLSHITGIRTDTEVVHAWWHGFKLPGSNIPGILTAGTFYQDGKRVFWDIHHPEEAVIISLDHESYDELVVEVENPEAFVSEVQARIKA